MSSTRVVVAAAAMLLGGLVGGAAFAQDPCPCGSGTRVGTAAAVATLLGNKTVCAAAGNDSWQEFHSGATEAGGPLIDYKLGPGHPVDPSETVGSWSVVSGAGTRTGAAVSHNYGSGGTYTYVVCDAAGTVNFCGAPRNVTGATLRNGQVSCSGAARAARGAR